MKYPTPEEKAVRFFQLNFPERKNEVEQKTDYFLEWVDRFESPNPTHWMDSESLKTYIKMMKEFQ